jgi:ubiquinone biosynthesis protein COQ9
MTAVSDTCADGSETKAEERDRLLLAALPHVPFDGWGQRTLERAADSAGLERDAVRRLFPEGATSAIVHFMDLADRQMLADLAQQELAGIKTRERVALAIRLRFERWLPHREAIRRAIASATLPHTAGRGLRGWLRTVDAIWRGVGDKSADFSFYTKRVLLAGVYGATLLYWLDDRSEGCAATWAFLDRRLADVMRIPKLRQRMSESLKRVPRPLETARRVFRNRSRAV